MSVPRIKKNDTVIAISGASVGKSGKVLQVLPEKGRAVVEGLNIRKRTVRKSEEQPQGGFVDKEAPIAVSNLMLFCPGCKKGVRTTRATEGEKRVRKCRACAHSFDG